MGYDVYVYRPRLPLLNGRLYFFALLPLVISTLLLVHLSSENQPVGWLYINIFLIHTTSYRILPHLTAFYRFLPHFTETYRMLPIRGSFAVARTANDRITNGKRTVKCIGNEWVCCPKSLDRFLQSEKTISPQREGEAFYCGEMKRLWYYNSFFLRLRIMSSVMRSRSYCGFQPHSLRAQLSSILSGQLSAMACLMGSGSYTISKLG